MRPDLNRMFYPLDRPQQNEWAEIVHLPHEGGDHRDAWDVFRFSRLSDLHHGNRVSGPGAQCGR